MSELALKMLQSLVVPIVDIQQFSSHDSGICSVFAQVASSHGITSTRLPVEDLSMEPSQIKCKEPGEDSVPREEPTNSVSCGVQEFHASVVAQSLEATKVFLQHRLRSVKLTDIC